MGSHRRPWTEPKRYGLKNSHDLAVCSIPIRSLQPSAGHATATSVARTQPRSQSTYQSKDFREDIQFFGFFLVTENKAVKDCQAQPVTRLPRVCQLGGKLLPQSGNKFPWAPGKKSNPKLPLASIEDVIGTAECLGGSGLGRGCKCLLLNPLEQTGDKSRIGLNFWRRIKLNPDECVPSEDASLSCSSKRKHNKLGAPE